MKTCLVILLCIISFGCADQSKNRTQQQFEGICLSLVKGYLKMQNWDGYALHQPHIEYEKSSQNHLRYVFNSSWSYPKSSGYQNNLVLECEKQKTKYILQQMNEINQIKQSMTVLTLQN